ncbi:hypothetical protein SDC9_20796 [bioreactor metagenome]|uniref:Uncharacterized protein n=1 Tax=bioreactor metagenome TaxID=1076179 RepID=A0A644U7Q0_9ZZZZ
MFVVGGALIFIDEEFSEWTGALDGSFIFIDGVFGLFGPIID